MKAEVAAATEPPPVTGRMWAVGNLVAMSSFLFGYNMAVMNACIKKDEVGSVLNNLPLTTLDQELTNALAIGAAMVGCLVANVPSESLGRKRCLLWNNVLFIVGTLMAATAPSVALLLLGRLVVGLAVGVASVVPPVLLSEVASKDNRGKITTLHQLHVTIGILVSGIVGYIFVTHVTDGWRVVVGLGVVPSVIQILGIASIPESPRWLLRHATEAEAAAVLRSGLRADAVDIDAELEVMNAEAASDAAQTATWGDLFSMRKPLLIGLGLLSAMAATGINAVIIYSADIFAYAGVSQAILATVIVFALNVGMTVLSGYLIDRAGRKVLLVRGTLIMCASQLVLALVLLNVTNEAVLGPVAVSMVLLFVAGFAVGLGAVAWTTLSEVMPTRVRSKGFSLCVTVNWVWNFIIGLTTLSIIEGIGGGDSKDDKKKGVAWLFLIFNVCSWLTLLFLITYVPETKGVEMEKQAGNIRRQSEARPGREADTQALL